jgi:hypothetical protein
MEMRFDASARQGMSNAHQHLAAAMVCASTADGPQQRAGPKQ